ncbi:MAG: hypothetical protein R2797_00045 [Gelidibacter sp.]
MNNIFWELKALSVDGIYKKDNIEQWLLKHKMTYEKVFKIYDTLNKEFPNSSIRQHKDFEQEGLFLDTYEVLMDVIECYYNEIFYKVQIEFYNKIKDDKHELNSWLWMHRFDEGKMQSKFRILFQNNSSPSGYEFRIRYPFSLPVTINLDEKDFQYTLQFMDIIKN